jgi:hypothetical protein
MNRALHFLLLVPTLLLAACTSSPTASESTSQPTLPTTEAADTLRTVSIRRSISDLGAPDVFRLQVLGDSLLTAPAVLTIHSASGQELYRQQLNPGDLEAPLVYVLNGEPATPARRLAYVRWRLTHFFADSCFSTPAVGPQETYSPGFVDRATWDDLRRPGTIAFRYLVGKEDGHRLAWSARQKKVVRFGAFGG